MAAVHPFDLQSRAELATQGLTALLDPEREGLMYFLADWRARPPRADHGLWDCGDGSGRQVDALTLARCMVRQDSPAAAPAPGDAQLEGWMLRLLGEDGLSWLPAEPWAEPWGKDFLLAHWRPGLPSAEISWAQRGTLMGLLTRLRRTGDERYLARARAMVDGLLGIALRHPDGLLLPEGYYQPGGWGRQEPGLCPGLEEYNAVIAAPALGLYEDTGYEPALALAEGLISFALKHAAGYLPDGAFRPPEPGQPEAAHFHTRTSFCLGVLKLGLVAGRRELVAWARQSYEQARTWGTDFGWFPEGLGTRHGELCCTTDMIELALLLGRCVHARYYADAERYGRNHLLESQFLSLERLEQALERLPIGEGAPPFGGRYSTHERVAARQVGAFASRAALNDAFHLDAAALMQCCNAAATRGLYDLWHHAVEEVRADDGALPRLNVHLRFSVQTPAVRVVSHEPAEGRLDITVAAPCEVMVRLPEGEAQALAALAGDEPRVEALAASDGYVRFAALPGQPVALHYALRERSACYEVGSPGRQARCLGHWRGETLMSVDPPGPFLPLYGRAPNLEPVQPALPAASQIRSL